MKTFMWHCECTCCLNVFIDCQHIYSTIAWVVCLRDTYWTPALAVNVPLPGPRYCGGGDRLLPYRQLRLFNGSQVISMNKSCKYYNGGDNPNTRRKPLTHGKNLWNWPTWGANSRPKRWAGWECERQMPHSKPHPHCDAIQMHISLFQWPNNVWGGHPCRPLVCEWRNLCWLLYISNSVTDHCENFNSCAL